MEQLRQVPEPTAILRAINDILYVTDPSDVILDVAEEPWRVFASANDAATIANRDQVVGRTLESFISGEAAKAAHRAQTAVLVSGERTSIEYRSAATRRTSVATCA